MDRRVTPPKRATSPTLGPPPPSKQALNHAEESQHYMKPKNTCHCKTRTPM